MTAGPGRRPWLDRVVPLGIVAGCVLILALGVGSTFNGDEWDFIARDAGDPGAWLAPHNQHWVTVPFAVYRLVLAVAGLRTYVPYLAVLLVVHGLVVGGSWLLNRRALGSAAAILALPVLFMGSGAENLFWAFQLGVLIAVACGVWALVALERLRPPRAAVVAGALLTAGAASTAFGLVLAVVVATEVALTRGWRAASRVAAGPVAAFAGWLALEAATGASAPLGTGPPAEASASSPLALAGNVVAGIGAAAGALSGVGPTLGIVLVPVAALLPVLALWRAWPGRARVVAASLGVLLVVALVAVARSADPDPELAPRYTYVTFVLGQLALAPVLAAALAARPGPAVRLALAAVLALSVAWNALLLVVVRGETVDQARLFRAIVAAAIDPAQAPDVADDASLFPYPSRATLRDLVARYGDPARDVLAGSVVPPLLPSDLAAGRDWLHYASTR